MKDFKVLSKDECNYATSYKGYINTTYGQLLEVLGDPTYNEPSGDDKTQVEWIIEFKGEIFTIYDWKTFSREYTENELDRFNIGGKSSAVDFINMLATILKR